MNSRLWRKDGFTLLEIIFVIMILGILAGIFTPVAFRLIQQDRTERTLKEMEEIKKGLIAYYRDNNIMPPEYIDYEIVISPATTVYNQVGLSELAIERKDPSYPTTKLPPPYWDGPYIDVDSVWDVQSDEWGRLKEYPWNWGTDVNYTQDEITLPASYIYDRDPVINDEVGGSYGDIKAIIYSRGPDREVDCMDKTTGKRISLNNNVPNTQGNAKTNYIDGSVINWDMNNTCGDDLVVKVSVKEVDNEKEALTRDDLTAIRYAMVGNPDLFENGRRTDFGFVGDIGQLPYTFKDLIELPKNCDTEYGGAGNGGCACGAGNNELCNWNGPYLDTSVLLFDITNTPIDRWKNSFVYNPIAGADVLLRRNRVRNDTDDVNDTDDPVRSIGRDQDDDFGDTDNTNTCVRFCDDITLIDIDGVDANSIVEPFFTASQVLPAVTFSFYIEITIYNGTMAAWPPAIDSLDISVFFDYIQGDGRMRSAVAAPGDPPDAATTPNPVAQWPLAKDLIPAGSSRSFSGIFNADLTNRLPIGQTRVTANATVPVTGTFPNGDNVKTILREAQILPGRPTVSASLLFGTVD